MLFISHLQVDMMLHMAVLDEFVVNVLLQVAMHMYTYAYDEPPHEEAVIYIVHYIYTHACKIIYI